MNEKTVVVTVDLPPGRDWELYADANVVALAPHLDQQGRDRALHEVCAQWRRSLVHVVPSVTAAAAAVAAVIEVLPVAHHLVMG